MFLSFTSLPCLLCFQEIFLFGWFVDNYLRMDQCFWLFSSFSFFSSWLFSVHQEVQVFLFCQMLSSSTHLPFLLDHSPGYDSVYHPQQKDSEDVEEQDQFLWTGWLWLYSCFLWFSPQQLCWHQHSSCDSVQQSDTRQVSSSPGDHLAVCLT